MWPQQNRRVLNKKEVNEMIGIEEMVDAIAMVMEEHGIMYEDGHWLTSNELATLPYEEVRRLFDFCYGSESML